MVSSPEPADLSALEDVVAPEDMALDAVLSAGERMELLNIDVQSLAEITTRHLVEASFARQARSAGDLRELLFARLAAVDAQLTGSNAYASMEDIASCHSLPGRLYHRVRYEIRALREPVDSRTGRTGQGPGPGQGPRLSPHPPTQAGRLAGEQHSRAARAEPHVSVACADAV